ncbi:acyl carrier protein [Saccharopolyspora oryzae]|uniref:Acyl carrier protein n=1 Tax=Saccharopolyspora oryzae TaxID=2997343 RepID=A0ABT4V6Q5_9PSEU|nr:acyl carrier protein [Saccharopolyspora oryzae]MDA3629655.1 acyl carrier protein [Saccharopolyspora oryzae]
MSETTNASAGLTVESVQEWIVAQVAARLETTPDQVDVHKYFDEFGVDSADALVLAGELEKWLGFELETTAMWYHPTIAELAAHIVERSSLDGAP